MSCITTSVSTFSAGDEVSEFVMPSSPMTLNEVDVLPKLKTAPGISELSKLVLDEVKLWELE